MARITLLRPATVFPLGAYSIGAAPPLGLAYIAAALEKAGNVVTVIDAFGEAPLSRHRTAWPDFDAMGLDIPEIVDRIPPGTQGIGISAMFSQQWPHVAALVAALHARYPEIPVFVGSEHATAAWEYVLTTSPGTTICVLGEGEETAVEVAEWLDGKRAIEDIHGIAYRRDGQPVANQRRTRVTALDAIPRPAWHLFPVETYLGGGYGHGVTRGRSLPILATRGCPYQCTFCSSPGMWTTRYYVRDVADVVDEIEEYVRTYRVSNVDFEDLTAFIKRDWILAFCRELERRALPITFQLPTGTRSEALDEEVLTALYRAGCRNMTYAPESGSENVLGQIKKKVKLDRMVASMEAALRLGMTVRVNMMIGFPEESRRDMLDTLHFGLRLAWRGVEVPLFPFVPLPGTALYDDLRRENRIGPLNDDFLTHLHYQDFWTIQSHNRFVGPRELNFYRIAGMMAFLLLRYAASPRLVARTIRNLARGECETAFEHRILEGWAFRRQQRAQRRQQQLASPAPSGTGVATP